MPILSNLLEAWLGEQTAVECVSCTSARNCCHGFDPWSFIMSNIRNGGEVISRRVVLAGTVLALGVAATGTITTQAAAQQKVSQADAKYQGQPKGQQRCDGCVNFQPPNACKIVQGEISPSGWCQLFAAKT